MNIVLSATALVICAVHFFCTVDSKNRGYGSLHGFYTGVIILAAFGLGTLIDRVWPNLL